MSNDLQKRYLLVAIDRATRWVYLEVADNKEAKTGLDNYTHCPSVVGKPHLTALLSCLRTGLNDLSN